MCGVVCVRVCVCVCVCVCVFLVIVALPVCPGLPSVVLWVSWPLSLSICVWPLSSTPRRVSHHLLCVLRIARCRCRALLLGGSYSSGLVTCRCLGPARHDGYAMFVSAWSCKAFLFFEKN
jgi:hypothetical protein